MPGFLSSRPNWVPPSLGLTGKAHSLSEEGVGGHNSDGGTDTLALNSTNRGGWNMGNEKRGKALGLGWGGGDGGGDGKGKIRKERCKVQEKPLF